MANRPEEEPHLNPNEAAAEDAAHQEKPGKQKSKGAMLGWVISGLILVGAGVFVLAAMGFFNKDEKFSTPFGNASELTTAKGALSKIDIYYDIGKLVAGEPAGTGAEKTYQELLKATQALTVSPDALSEDLVFAKGKELEKLPPEKVAAILDVMMRAADQGYDEKVPLTFAQLPVSMTNEVAYADLVAAWGRIPVMHAFDLYKEQKNYAEAEKAYRAAFIFGKRLWLYGLYTQAREKGFRACNNAINGLIRLYEPAAMNDPAKLAIAKEIHANMQGPGKKWTEKQDKLILNMLRASQESWKNAGADLWNLAEKDEDPSWRLEAVMWFGLAKFLNGVNEAKVNAYLEKRSSDSDPLIAEKAKEARAYTKEVLEQFKFNQ